MQDKIIPDLQLVDCDKPETQNHDDDSATVPCDRCSGPMFRMRAVYWCTNCGYKTDCCGH